MKLRVVGILVLALLGLVPITQARAAEEWTTTETTIRSADGTPLHAYVHRPAGVDPDEKTPVSLIVSPYLNSGGGWFLLSGPPDPLRQPPFMAPMWPDLVRRGFTEVAVEPRGYGGSGGCSDFGGPGEQSDVRSAIEWAAEQPWSTGKVGIFGYSYEGGMAASAVADPPPALAAALLGVPITSYYRYVQTNGVNNITEGETIYNVPHGLLPPSAFDDPEYQAAAASGLASDPRCHVEGTVSTATQLREIDPYWQARDFTRGLETSSVPVFFNGGLQDENVVPQYILPYVNRVRGPLRAWIGQWRHNGPLAGEYGAEAIAWFEHYVADRPVQVQHGFAIQATDGSWRTAKTWPSGASRSLTVPLVPGSYRELEYTLGDGNATDLWPPMGVIPPEPARPALHWAAVTQPMPHEVHLVGDPVITVDVDIELPRANVVVVVLDIHPDGQAHYLTRGAHLAQGNGPLTFDLFPQDWVLAAGHRLGVYVAGASSVHYNGTNRWLGSSGGRVDVKSGSVRFPALAERPERCTAFNTGVRTVDVIFRLSPAEAAAAAVSATLPAAYSGTRPCEVSSAG